MFNLPREYPANHLKFTVGEAQGLEYICWQSFAVKSMALINYPGRLQGTSETSSYLAVVSLHAPFGFTHIQRGIVQAEKQKSASGTHSGGALPSPVPYHFLEKKKKKKKKNQTEAQTDIRKGACTLPYKISMFQ